MTLHTLGVASHTAPTGLITYLKHFLYHRSQRKGQPTAQISYDEGLAIVRQFLSYASTHTLAELQHFTANHVPTPHWVSKEVVEVAGENIEEAAQVLRKQLEADPGGLERVGGGDWWQIRGTALTGEWIEMRKEKVKRGSKEPERVLLYVHGGAYFFSSLETHRYQIQRHSRKLNARAFAPSYRLAPQYPFPCALQDLLSSYLFLIRPPPTASHAPVPSSHIVLSGDSSGAGLALALLVLLRDQGIERPAAATLISPWVDLAHSFPSLMDETKAQGDYIPAEGFHYKPGIAWPPLKGDGIRVVIEEGEEPVLLDEQIQMYCPNTLLTHPLISLVNQGSLGGLPPLMILGGSAELLIDEIVYIAHKAASPSSYPPSLANLAAYPSQQTHLDTTYPPTLVHLSIYDGCAHVTPTLSITRPAKFMYRSAANFGIWALTAARKREERHEAHHHSLASLSLAPTLPFDPSFPPPLTSLDAHLANTASHEMESDMESETSSLASDTPSTSIKVTGHEPPFHDSMIRERVSPNGVPRAMEPVSHLPALALPRFLIGSVHARGPIKRWVAKREEWEKRFEGEGRKWREVRERDGQGERRGVPRGALENWSEGERKWEAGESVDRVGSKKNLALAMWARASAKPDRVVVVGAGGKEKGGEGEAAMEEEVGGGGAKGEGWEEKVV